jgi:hypothetical protein
MIWLASLEEWLCRGQRTPYLYMPQYKFKRPSLKDAHHFHKAGSWSSGPEDRFTAKERLDAARAAAEEIKKKCRDALPRTRNLELLILKCHIVLEFAIEAYMRALSAGLIGDDELRLRFEEKVNVAFMLGLGIDDPVLLPSILLINRIRNDIAHRLTLNEDRIDELLQINCDDCHGKKKFTHKERLRGLKSITWGICGLISGLMVGRVFAEENKELLSSDKHPKKT